MTELEKDVEEALKWYNQTSRGVETGEPEREFIKALLTLIESEVRKATLDEWKRFKTSGLDPNKTLAQVLMYADARIKELVYQELSAEKGKE